MGFRTVVVKSRAKLEFRLDSLIIRGETEHKIYVGEINTLIVQSTAVSLTASLLSELVKRNIKVIFCDEKCNPCADLLPYYGAQNASGRLREQVGWPQPVKRAVWRRIVIRKIGEQSSHLADRGFAEQAKLLESYAEQVTDGDETNREGHAAKVYFNCLLGMDASRRDDSFANACLNYGYAILLSAFNREIVASGYLTQIGVWHDNEFNVFNLACDLMEPLRVVVDRRAAELTTEDDFKRKMIATLNCRAVSEGKSTTLDVAIRNYTQSVFRALREQNASLVTFPEQVFWDDEL